MVLDHMFNEIEGRSLKLLESNEYMASHVNNDADIIEAIAENSEILERNQNLLSQIVDRLLDRMTYTHAQEYELRVKNFQNRLTAIENK